MKLAVLGSLQAALVNAAWASANSGAEVVHVTRQGSGGSLSVPVTWPEQNRTAHLVSVEPGTPVVADAFVIIAPRDESVALVRTYADSMRGKPVLLAPGGFAVVEAVDAVLNTGSTDLSPLGQLPGFPVIGDATSERVTIRSVKRSFPVGPLHDVDAVAMTKTFQKWIPDLVPSSLAETTLSNTNNMLHPPILLLNMARSENSQPYRFYKDGLTSAASRLIVQVDHERLELLRTLGQDQVPFDRWIERYYGDQGAVGDTIEEMVTSFPAFANSPGPATLEHRYISEDVVYGLAPMEELARQLGVATPVLTSVITLLSTACGTDLRDEARRLIRDSAMIT